MSHIKIRLIVCVCLILPAMLLVNCCSASGEYTNNNQRAMEGDQMSATTKEDLTNVAKDSASKAGIDVSSCSVSIKREGDFTVVEFQPKRWFQLGGGGKVYFEEKDGKYTFVKGVRFQ